MYRKMPSKRGNRKRSSRRRNRATVKRMKGGCAPCVPPLAQLVGLGGVFAGATVISRSSSRTKGGKIHNESETHFMKNESGKKMSIRVYEKDGDIKMMVGSNNFKVKPGETRKQALQRAIRHCEQRGYKGCADTSKKHGKRVRSKKRKKRTERRFRMR